MSQITPHSPLPQHNHYMPYLDGLRAVAIVGVFIAHFAYTRHWLMDNAQWGRLGVDIFFVLSGFLITQILFRYRNAISSNGNLVRHLQIFYGRRILRIFPIYYLTIGIAALLGYEPVRDYLVWFLTYTSNVVIGLYNRPQLGSVNHIWTLAIEEQFYLFWPLIIFLVPKQKLHWTIIGLIIIGPITRILPLFIPWWTKADAMLYTRIDLLGMGALLAFYWQNPLIYQRAKPVIFIGASIGLPVVVFSLTASLKPGLVDSITNALTESAVALIAAVLIDRAAQLHPPRILAPLGWKPIRYIGKISYGIYVYHLFVRLLMPNILQMFNLKPPPLGWVQVLLYGFVSILVASISWYVIERPINKWKDKLFVDAPTPTPVLDISHLQTKDH